MHFGPEGVVEERTGSGVTVSDSTGVSLYLLLETV